MMPSAAAVHTSRGATIPVEPERQDIADGAAHEQNARPARTRRLVQLGLNGNRGSPRDGGESLFAPQLANSVIGVKGAERNPHPQNDRHQSDQLSVHTLLLLL